MISRGARALSSDGLLPGLVRLLLTALYAFALAAAVRGGDAAAGALMSLVFALVLGCIVGRRELVRALVAPDWALWHPENDWGLGRRLAGTGCRFVAAWIFWTCATVGIIPHGGFVAFLPLAASAVQRSCRRRRRLDVLRTRGDLGRDNVSGP